MLKHQHNPESFAMSFIYLPAKKEAVSAFLTWWFYKREELQADVKAMPAIRIGFVLFLLSSLFCGQMFAQESIYISNTFAGTVNKYDLAGNVVAAPYLSGLSSPTGLAIDAQGNLYVANAGDGTTGTGFISKYSPSGAPLSTHLVSSLTDPQGLVIGRDGNLYVSGTAQQLTFNNKGYVGKYSTAGVTINPKFITGIGSSGGVAPSLAIAANGDLLLTAKAAQISDLDFVRDYTTSGSLVTAALISVRDPIGLAVDRGGNIFVSSADGTGAVQEYDGTGTPLNLAFISGLHVVSVRFSFTSAGNLYLLKSGVMSVYSSSGVLKNAALFSPGTSSLHFMTIGAGTSSVPSTPPWAQRDFNGDYSPDVLWRNTSTGNIYIGVMNGLSITSYKYVDSVGAPWTIVGIGDFNNDTQPDILWRNPATGDIYIAIMNGTSVVSYNYVDSVGAPWNVVGVGDFDGDGKPDILWRNASTGDIYVGLMNGTHLTSYRYIDSVGAPFEIDAVADLNNDGSPDIIWRNPTTGDVYVCLMNRLTVGSYQFIDSIGFPWTIVGAADFNKDGYTDLLWWNPSNGNLYVGTMYGYTVLGYSYIDSVGSPWIPKD